MCFKLEAGFDSNQQVQRKGKANIDEKKETDRENKLSS